MAKTITWESRVNRKALSVTSLATLGHDVAFWHAQTPQRRLRTMELLRRINYGRAATTARLKRVLEVAQLEKAQQMRRLAVITRKVGHQRLLIIFC